MKIFIVVLCMAAVAAAGHIPRSPEDLNAARGVCVKKYEIVPERIAEYKKRIFRETDKETPLYIACVFEQLGLMRDGVFNTDDYLVQLGKGDGARDGVVGCLDKSDDVTIRAFRTFMCLIEKGLLPEGY